MRHTILQFCVNLDIYIIVLGKILVFAPNVKLVSSIIMIEGLVKFKYINI